MNPNIPQAAEMVSVFAAAGFTELDTALMYTDGKSETMIGTMPQVRGRRGQPARLFIHRSGSPMNSRFISHECMVDSFLHSGSWIFPFLFFHSGRDVRFHSSPLVCR